jgi:hypothetical protein
MSGDGIGTSGAFAASDGRWRGLDIQ